MLKGISILRLFIIVYTLCNLNYAKVYAINEDGIFKENKIQDKTSNDTIEGEDIDLSNQQLKIFQLLLKRKKAEYKDAVQSIMKYDLVKQYKLIETIIAKSLQVLEDSQVKLREGGYVPGMKFPEDERIREALSMCLENTVFLSEVILHFPEISHRIMSLQNSWNLIFTWGIFFASQSNFLDKKTKELVYLVSQEMNLSEKDEDYVNPYVTFQKQHYSKYEQNVKPKSKKKKKSFKRGPALSRNIDEL